MKITFLIAALLISQSAQAQDAVITFGPKIAIAQNTLFVHGSTDIEVFAPILKRFAEISPGLRIIYEERSTNDIYRLAELACKTGKDAVDLLISSSIDQQIKLVNDGCAQAHTSPGVDALPAWSKWRNEVFGLTYEPAVMVYNRQLLSPEDVPLSRFDLIDLLRPPGNQFIGRIATYDIEQSGLGYLFAFADSQQATTFGRLIEAFGRSKVVATCCSAELIDAVAEGKYLIAYNLLGSYALARAADDDRIGIIAPTDYTLILSRAALIPKQATNPDAAKRFIDFALSVPGRKILSEASLIVSLDDTEKDGPQILHGNPPSLRPMAFSPALLVGLDRQKRKIFVRLWRASINQ